MKVLQRILLFNVAVLVTLSTMLSAQQVDMELLKSIEPRNIGPAGMSGRITAIDVVESNHDIMYAGSASGGIWKSVSGGVAWEPIFDEYGVASIGAIDIYQASPDIVWVGTGEGNPRNSQSSGAGVYRSLDGGRSFEFMGLEGVRNVHRIIVHPTDPNTVWVGGQGDAWADSEHRGVYKTTDGGKTWDKVLYINSRTGVGDMVMDPSNPNKILVNMWEFRRWPWFFKSGGEGSGMYMTLDGGETWNEITDEDGMPEGELGRMGIAFSSSKPNIVYAIVESSANAIYRSEDGGFTWEQRQTVKDDPEVGNRPFYYFEIYVDPFNENRVYSIYTYLSVSEDGAKSFESLYPYYNWVHPDHHAFWMSSSNPGFIVEGNDGGLNISHDGGKTWRFAENIPVGQYYHVNVDMEIPYNVYGGMQDNGSWEGPAYVWRDGGIRNAYWDELFFGDGFDVMMDPSDSRYLYAMSQQGNVGRVDRETGSARFVKPTHPDGENLRFNWNAAINFDPFDSETIYFGSQYVHKSTDRGESWTIISPDLTTNDTTKQMQHESGGLTMDATGAENFTTILAIEPSPVEENVIWVGTDDGNIQVTTDGGENWSNTARNLKGIPEGSYVAQVKASAFNAGEAVAVINNYRRGDWTPYVVHTSNYGKKWTNIVEGKGLEGYALSFVQDLVEPNLMFVGTEFGLYFTIDGGDSWTRWANGYPTVSTYDMVIHPREHDLVIGTFGRSFWVLDDIRPLRELAAEGLDELDKAIKAFDSPDAYLANWRQAMGSRFAADAMYSGDNRPRGAMITYSVNKELSQKSEKSDAPAASGRSWGRRGSDEEKVKVAIFDESGENIRNFEVTPDRNGVNRMQWGLERKGMERPSRRAARPNMPEPRGGDVLPGTYKVVMSYAGSKDSTMVTVHYDPRIEITMEALEATAALEDSAGALGAELAKAVSSLVTAEGILKVNKGLMDADPRSTEELKEVHDTHKATQESLDALYAHIFGSNDDERQGIVRNPEVTVMSRLYGAGRYLGNDIDGPGATEENLLRLAREAVTEAMEKIDVFLNQDWPTYEAAVREANLSPFKSLTGEDN
jgi:photosystem II stability/assembly factor-like uncharacterized protein